MNIRDFAGKDQKKVEKLISTIFAEEYPFEKSAYSDEDLQDISSSYNGQRDAFFVAEVDDVIIGTVGIKEDSLESALMRQIIFR